MANYRDVKETERIRTSVLLAAAKLFVAKGFANASIQQIADTAGIHKSTLMYVFKSKDDVLAELVRYMLVRNAAATETLLDGKTKDPILLYASELALRLYTAESQSHIRDLYVTVYTLPKTCVIIHQAMAGRLEEAMGQYLPGFQTKDFFELELASGGILRSFMAIPCDLYFTMERKVRRVLESVLLLCRVPDEKIQEALDFVSQFDWSTIVQNTIHSTRAYLESQI